MGTYIQWLLEGLKSGQDRDTVLADAAERYGTKWGHDKVTLGNSTDPKGALKYHEPDPAVKS